MKKLITICVAIGILLTVSANVKGALIADPCLLLHFDSTTDGQTTTVDSSPHVHTIALVPQAQLDTAYQAVGTASLLLDGSGDYATAAPTTSADWDIVASNADNWTVDFYVRLDNHSTIEGLMYQGSNASNRWAIRHYGSGTNRGFIFTVMSSMSEVISTGYGGEITDSDWHWIALCKVGSNYAIYKDGTQVNYTPDTSTANFTGLLNIGRTTSAIGYYYTNGNMDEVRIFHANVFGAAPNSGKTDFINIPEPATMALFGLGSLALLRKRRARNEPGLKAASQSVASDALRFRA
ncbi:MAG: PEP-CTERM sorting domain-containing protein [Sedimentisphaerales bacterium]|nr:PEP-CTERM sorting domain-containing protein [Sedimentisphaerales bacterium]